MPQLCDPSMCTGCFACANACSRHAIDVQTDDQGFPAPNIVKELCVNCGICEKACPQRSQTERQNTQTPTAYAAWHKDEKTRLDSSSGGAFSALSETIIERGGEVYGAAWKEGKLEVEHIRISTKEDLPKLQKSKYLPSEIGESYRLVLQDLKAGVPVLFSGTPCQIAGLYAFLGNKYFENLYTVDFICHGVPSPNVFYEYIKTIESKYDDHISEVNFRDKKYGVECNLTINVLLEKKNKHILLTGNDISFYRGFIGNLYLRQSCYNCRFNALPRQADITLADYRGLGDKSAFEKEKDRPWGFTGTLVNSEKGRILLQESSINIIERPFTELTSAQPHLKGPAKKPTSYEAFWNDFYKKGYEITAQQHMPFSIKNRLVFFLRQALGPAKFYAIGRLYKRFTGKRNW